MQLRVRGPGHVALAVSTAGLGILCLVYGDFVPQWQPAPPWFPWRHFFAYASGVVLLAGGLGVLWPRPVAAWRAALALTAFHVVWVVAQIQEALPGLTGIRRGIGATLGVAEALGATVGCFTLLALLVAEGGPRGLASLGSRRALRVAEVLFGLSCVVFGLAHFAYAEFTGSMIPGWLPARTGLAYLTGACHAAAGLALLTTVGARLAATLEAVMLGVFVLLIHVPSLVTAPAWAPSRQIQWTELFLGLLLTGSAAVVATALRDRPWLGRR